MLHFRHFLITALMVGAALILPGNAFAAKTEDSGQLNSHKELAQANNSLDKTGDSAIKATVHETAENVKPEANPVVVPKLVSNNQSNVKQQANHRSVTPKQVVSKLPTTAPKNLPVQVKSNKYGQSALKKAEKTVMPPGQKKSVAVKESTNRPTAHVENDHFLVIAIVKNKTESTSLGNQLELQGQGSNRSIPKKRKHFEPFISVSQQKGTGPIGKKEIPTVDQAINQTQRSSSSSGGQSNDRVSQSLNTISLLDKWFEWLKYVEIKRVQPYLSRYALRNHQWVNAPPSPPPQRSSYFINR